MRLWPLRARVKTPTGRLLAINPTSRLAQEYVILKGVASLGSEPSNDFVIAHDTTSRRHAIVRRRFGRYSITDLGSANGTFVNGARISGVAPLEKGDEIRLGAARLILANPPTNASSRRHPPGARTRVSMRVVAEMALVAFVGGFGLAQYLAYLSYHQEHAFVLGEAVPLPHATDERALKPNRALAPAPGQTPGPPPLAPSKPSGGPAANASSIARSAPGSFRAARSDVAEIPAASKSGEEAWGNDLAGALALGAMVPGSGTLAGRLAAPFTLRDLEGKALALSSLRGSIVFLNVWATWCPVCRREMPALERLRKDLSGSQNFRLLTVSEDQNRAAVVSFIENNGYTFRVLLDPENRMEASYDVRGLPSTIIINRQGVIVWNVTGGLDWSSPALRQALKKLL